MDSKKIIIQGTSNKYQIKKCMKIPKEIVLRKSASHIPPEYFSHLYQSILLKREDVIADKILVEQLSSKLSSYKQQDIEKNILDSISIVKLTELFELLTTSNLACYYCSQSILLLYSNVREKTQWTLDRIDNSKGHNVDNVLIACLDCNLKRRNKNKNAFHFTKNLTIVQVDKQEQNDG
jgi:hypothetical protein